MKRIPLIAVPIAIALAAAAVAFSGTSLPARGTLLGGGTVTPGYNPTGGYGLGFVSLAVARADGRSVVFYGDWNALCPGYAGPVTATFAQRVQIAADGSFSGQGPIPSTIAVGTFSFAGRFDGSSAAFGNGRVVFKYRPGDVTYDCDSHNVNWEARASVPARGVPSPQSGARYFGNTSQTLPIVLQLSRDGSQIAQAALLWNVSCQRHKAGIGRGTVSPPMQIVNGRFGAKSDYTDYGIEPGVMATITSTRNGRFGAHSAQGTWRIHILLQRIKDKEPLDVCDSGLVRWHASL